MLNLLQKQVLSLRQVHEAEVFASMKGKRSSFILAYEQADGDLLSDLDAELSVRQNGTRKTLTARQWLIRRDRFLTKFYPEWKGKSWWSNRAGRPQPTREHCALIMWAASPTPERLRDWLRREREQMLLSWSSEEVPF